ncbi:hypothetical protein L2E82_32798 [Cichorium intybus]|uniref:Uncharacterized protein n=1 Tax=Cichorium intybus TaxID=13427 RepID=A0ACB9BJ41_CICIN|nr:hypothetical protein L2E82_32798 [Cichorium intybus]
MENQINSGKYDEYECESKTTWTRDEDKLFETALVNVPENIEWRWQKIAESVPSKTAEQVRTRYDELLHDLDMIKSRRVELPRHADDFVSSDYDSRSSKYERKKGIPWTREEHSKFLKGLETYKKGDWRSISRMSVITRTPTQVASHAQKYFLRQKLSQQQKKKRSSIHDITTAEVVTPINFCSPQGGGGTPPPQIGYEHQKNFGPPN